MVCMSYASGAESCTALLCQAELLGAPTATAAGLLPCPVTGEHDAQLTSGLSSQGGIAWLTVLALSVDCDAASVAAFA